MKIFGLSGWSGGGKTTLMVALLEELSARGFTVSTIKHAHHDFDIDQPGKDSYRHRSAGAREVLVGSGRRWALMHELRDAPEPTLEALLTRLDPVDLVLIEGFKRDRHAKIEVHRGANNKPLLHGGDRQIVAIAADVALDGLEIPHFDLNDINAIADFILAHTGLPARKEAMARGTA